MSVELFLAVASFAVAVFALGYMLGQTHAKNRNDRPSPSNLAVILTTNEG